MNALGTLSRLAVAVGLASFAASAMGVDKFYGLSVEAQAANSDGSVPMKLVLKNEAPPGTANSNIGSFVVTPVGVTIAPKSITSCGQGKCSVQGNTLTVTNIKALQAQQTLEVDFATTSCGDAHWFATVYNGSGLTGQTFALSTTDPDFAVPDDQKTSVSCGMAACTGATFVVADSTNPSTTSLQYVTGVRSALNKDGNSACLGTDYFVSNMLASSTGQLHFRWAISSGDNPQPGAVFQYTLNLPTSNVGVAWLNGDGSPATDSDPSITDPLLSPSFIKPAPACLTSLAPAPYAQLQTGISKDIGQITVVNSLPPGQLPSRPFPAVIGSERISVLQVSGNGTWTVLRGQGGTPPATHDPGAAVMSTPLPILPAPVFPYQTSDDPPQAVQAQVCIIGAPSQNSNGTWKATFFDIGDAWTTGR